jgi:tRNA(Ile)-lysidine synthase
VASKAAGRAEALGARAIVRRLVWQAGERPTQAAARAKRYAALAAIAREAGQTVVHLAHTLDDQLETLLLRDAAMSGPRGKAGIAALSPLPIWPEGRGLWAARPLLVERREALRLWLKAKGVPWHEDPANQDRRFARVRTRDRIACGAVDEVALIQMAAAAAGQAMSEDRHVQGLGLTVDPSGGINFSQAAFAQLAPGAAKRAVSVSIQAIAGRAYPPQHCKLGALADAVQKATGPGRMVRTLNGARIEVKAGLAKVGRDPGAVIGRAGQPGLAPLGLTEAPQIWDRRLCVRALAPGLTLIAAARPPDPAAPVILAPGDAAPRRLGLSTAAEMGLVEAQWLVSELLSRLLWRANAAITAG